MQSWDKCGMCNEVYHEDSISYCDKCGECVCDECAPFPGEYLDGTDFLLHCPICAIKKNKKDNPHKDFLGYGLNIGDDIVFCDSIRTSRWLARGKITKLMDTCCNITVSSGRNTRKDYGFIIKIR